MTQERHSLKQSSISAAKINLLATHEGATEFLVNTKEPSHLTLNLVALNL